MRRWSPAARALTLTGWLTTLVSLPLWLGWQSSMPHGWWIAGVLSLPLLAAGPGLWREGGAIHPAQGPAGGREVPGADVPRTRQAPRPT